MTAYLLLATMLVALIVSVVATAVRDRSELDEEDGTPTAEAREKEALEALRELEFDYETGVVTEEEYRRRRPELAREAVDAHQEVETAGGAGGAAAAGAEAEGGDGAGPPAHCSSCGASLRPGSRFCARCGAPVDGDEAGGRRSAGKAGDGR